MIYFNWYKGGASGSKAAFSTFQQKDVAAGGTGKVSRYNYWLRNDRYKQLFSSEQGAAAPTNPSSIKERLLAWCQQSTKGYAVSY
jgi:hypothetical protein